MDRQRLLELAGVFESRMAEVDDIYTRAEELAYEESQGGNRPVDGDRIFAIAKQIIHNEIRDAAQAASMTELISERINKRHMGR
jgi:hypothetical protein